MNNGGRVIPSPYWEFTMATLCAACPICHHHIHTRASLVAQRVKKPPARIHADIWQNQYNIVKLKINLKKYINLKLKKRNHLQCRRAGFSSWVGKIPWRRACQPTSVFLPGEFHRQRSLAGYTPWGHKESDTITLIRFYCYCDSSFIDKDSVLPMVPQPETQT